MTATRSSIHWRRWLGAVSILLLVLLWLVDPWKPGPPPVRVATRPQPTGDAALASPQEPSVQVYSQSDPQRGAILADPFGALNPNAKVGAIPLGEPASAGPPPQAVAARPVASQATPAVAVAAPPPSPPPTAPPLPFTAFGSLSGKELGDGSPVAFLRANDTIHAVRAGDEIMRTYRVDRVLPDRVELTYLPLAQRQTLPIAP